MSIEERITVSYEDMARHLDQQLSGLARFAMDRAYRDILGETFVQHLDSWLTRIRERRQDPFTIVVAGEFKRGKSSLINAILGEKILPTNVAPETVTINTLSYGAHKNEAVLSGGRRLSLTDDELKRKSLKKLEEEVGEPICRLELKRMNERLRDIRIVDTPGMNDALDRFEDMVAEALAQADAVIYVYSVQSPLSRSERMYLRYSVLPQQYTRLFLVGNFADAVPTEEFEEVTEFVTERADEILLGRKSYVVSALDELCRAQGGKRPNGELIPALEAGFDGFRADMEELIEGKKSVIALDRIQRMCRLMKESLLRDLSGLESGLAMDEAKLREERERLEQSGRDQNRRMEEALSDLKTEIAGMKRKGNAWLSDLLDRMEDEDLSVYSVHEILRYYSYYCVELVQKAVQESLEYHRECILERLHQISEGLCADLSVIQEKKNYVDFAFRLDNNTWTKGDSVTLAISQVSGNALLSLVSDLTGSMLRKKEVEADRETVLQKVKEQFPHLRESVKRNLELQYARLETSAGRLLEEYYGERVEEAEEMLKLFASAREKSAADQKEMRSAIRELQGALEQF